MLFIPQSAADGPDVQGLGPTRWTWGKYLAGGEFTHTDKHYQYHALDNMWKGCTMFAKQAEQDLRDEQTDCVTTGEDAHGEHHAETGEHDADASMQHGEHHAKSEDKTMTGERTADTNIIRLHMGVALTGRAKQILSNSSE